MSRRQVAGTLAMAVLLTLAAGPVDARAPRRAPTSLPEVVDLGRDELTRALTSGRLAEARYALERARSLFRLPAVRSRWGYVARPDPRFATAILRDLAVRIRNLHGADRAAARALLARPTDGAADPVGDGYAVAARDVCSAHVCYHWVESTSDAVPLIDANSNGIPDWVEITQAVAETVWVKEVDEYGYRPPKSDATSANAGPNGRLDIYLANLGDDGLYGYCTTDDPNLLDVTYTAGDFSAYCVIDNNYAEYPMNTPLENLQVTVAHEFFHSVQFAYDLFEDLWLMEGTAAWIEDEVFDAVDDNYQYLFASALAFPDVSIDYSSDGFAYGAWLFWRFLSEYSDPSIVRDVWTAADASAGASNNYSLAAAEAALDARGIDFADAFAAFTTGNYAPSSAYEEGVDYARLIGTPPLATETKLTPKSPKSARRSVRLDHLSSAYASFRPGKKLPNKARLKLSVDLPKPARAPAVTVLVVKSSGAIKPVAIPLDGRGDGSATVDFRRARVRRVVLVLTNASTRTACGVGSAFSCTGAPLDDNVRFSFSARAINL
jgi:hypothetical protein